MINDVYIPPGALEDPEMQQALMEADIFVAAHRGDLLGAMAEELDQEMMTETGEI